MAKKEKTYVVAGPEVVNNTEAGRKGIIGIPHLLCFPDVVFFTN